MAHLLPSGLWVDQHGQAWLQRINGGYYLRDVKPYFMWNRALPANDNMAPNNQIDPQVAAVAFLAMVLKRSRAWFLHHQRLLYGRFRLRWHMNLGLPSADFNDEGLCRRYRDAARAAWRLSLMESASLDAARRVLFDRDSAGANEADSAQIDIVPEVAAAVVGYARSHMREEELHLLVDVGAHTLDVCGFRLHSRDGDDVYALLTADVQELGAFGLHRARMRALRKHLPPKDPRLAELNEYDPVDPIPDPYGVGLPRSVLDEVRGTDKGGC